MLNPKERSSHGESSGADGEEFGVASPSSTPPRVLSRSWAPRVLPFPRPDLHLSWVHLQTPAICRLPTETTSLQGIIEQFGSPPSG